MRRIAVLGGFAVALTVGAVIASASPPSGVTGPILSRGQVEQRIVVGEPVTTTVTRKVRVRAGGRTYTRRVRVRVQSIKPFIECRLTRRCDTAVQQVTISPGGHTGWHTHPGPTFVTVAQGEGTLYHGGPAGTGCEGHRYRTGTGFFQPSADVHTLRNEGSSTLVVHALYLLAPGTPNTAIRTDQPQPANCPNIP
jgi:quercetin dioxygenase-like cupin family protein